jgi:hypothetical protein
VSIAVHALDDSLSPVQCLPGSTEFRLQAKDGEAGKIKGRGTPAGRLRVLHGGWRGTPRCFTRAAMTRQAAPLLIRHRAVRSQARWTMPERAT